MTVPSIDDIAGEFDDLDFLDLANEDSEEAALAIPEKADPGDPAEGETKPAEGEAKPAEGEAKPAEGEAKPAEGEAKPAEGETKKTDGDEQSEIETVSQLADAMGTTVEAVLGNLSHTVKVGDEDKTVTLADLTETYAQSGGLVRQAEQLTAEQQTFQETSGQQQELVDAYANSMLQLYNQLESEIQVGLNSPELTTLKTEDPAAYLIKADEIKGLATSISTARGQLMEGYTANIAEQRKLIVQREGQRLLRVDPTWDQGKLKKAWTALHSQGYSHDELQNNLDSRILLVAHELATLREENTTLKAAAKAGETAATKVKKTVPKFVLKGGKGATQGAQPAARASATARMTRAKQSGSLHDAVAAAMAIDMTDMEA